MPVSVGIVGDAVIERGQSSGARTVEGVVSLVAPAVGRGRWKSASERTGRCPITRGQYAQVRFSGYPSRPVQHARIPYVAIRTAARSGFHVRRMKDGRVTPALGKRIKPGHRVKLTGPYGSAHFRPNPEGRLILVATNTGFAPIWSTPSLRCARIRSAR